MVAASAGGPPLPHACSLAQATIALCQELGLQEKLDVKLGLPDERRVVSAGTAVVAMILNGLGFTNRRLYLTPQFFANKPVEKLLGAGVTVDALTDHTLC